MCGTQCLSPRGFRAGHPQYDRRLIVRVVMDRWPLPQPTQTHKCISASNAATGATPASTLGPWPPSETAPRSVRLEPDCGRDVPQLQ